MTTPLLFDRHGNPTLAPASDSRVGENLDASTAGAKQVFPADWLRLLHEVSPVSDRHSYLIPYWYRARERWVLYDLLPDHLLPPEHSGQAVAPGFTVEEYWRAMRGDLPSTRPDSDQTPYVSDAQWAMHHEHGGYARPFWVLQGPAGGHQVRFSPWQQNVLLAKHLPPEPPAIGDLPFAPMDGRAQRQLRHLNRLHQMEDSIEALRKSGSRAAADAEGERIQREIREAEYRFICEQMEPIVDMSMSLVAGSNTRSEHADQVVRVRPGAAAMAKDAHEYWLETGEHVPLAIGQ